MTQTSESLSIAIKDSVHSQPQGHYERYACFQGNPRSCKEPL